MPFRHYINLIERADALINRRNTGNASQIASTLAVSRRTWFYFLDQLINDLALPIAYDRHLKTYYYFDTPPDLVAFFKQIHKDPPQNLEKWRGKNS